MSTLHHRDRLDVHERVAAPRHVGRHGGDKIDDADPAVASRGHGRDVVEVPRRAERERAAGGSRAATLPCRVRSRVRSGQSFTTSQPPSSAVTSAGRSR